MSQLHSYPSIYNLGHRALAELLDGPVFVQEKVDGSQFSFGAFDTPEGVELRCRSKGADINPAAPEKMFTLAVESAQGCLGNLRLGWTYRCEYLQKPKHNTLAYSRVPNGHLVLFDVDTGVENYLESDAVAAEAVRLGLEPVPTFYFGVLDSFEKLKELLATESALGGVPVEGVVIKNYVRFGPDKKALMGKLVRGEFKEQHRAEWKATNPGLGDVVEMLILTLRTDARFAKAVQHLRELGRIEDSPRDIGPLLKELEADLHREASDTVARKLTEYAMPKIVRGVRAGFPEWYKEHLAKRQFGEAG